MIDSAYFCTTPYQLIASIILAMTNKSQKADLYIVNKFKDSEKIAARIQKIKIFDCVKVIDENRLHRFLQVRSKFLIHLSMVMDYFRVDRKAKQILISNTHYNKIYISSKAYTPRLVQFYCEKNSIDTEFVLYDDGLGSYINDDIINPSRLDRLVRLLAFRRMLGIQSAKRILYFPELYERFHPEHKKDLISCIPKEEIFNNRSTINMIFEYRDEMSIKEPVIILDDPRVLLSEKQNSTLEDIYELIIEYYGSENVLFKPHPRDKRPRLNKRKYYERTSLPFEVLCMNTDMEEKILVSMMSTAVVTPKLMFNQEPKVILLYKLLDGICSGGQEEIENVVNECSALYANPKRFLAPDSIQILKDYLKKETLVLSS